MWRLVIALSLLAFTACGPRPTPRTVAEVFLSSRDVGDVDGALSVMSSEVVLRAPNEMEYKGADQVRQWLRDSTADYRYQLAAEPIMSGNRVSWRDNLSSISGARWVGEIGWELSVSDLKITAIQGKVLRGASGIICPRCPPGTRI
jgi:hypothetical protein